MVDAELPGEGTVVRRDGTRAANIGLCKHNSTPSPLHCTSKSTISSPASACDRDLADHPNSPTPNSSAWGWPRYCSASTPNDVGPATCGIGSAISFLTCPPSLPTTGACGVPHASSPWLLVTWPLTPPLGGISSASWTRLLCPAVPPGKLPSVPACAGGPTTATALPTPASSGACVCTSSPPPTASPPPGALPIPSLASAKLHRPCWSKPRHDRASASSPTRASLDATSNASSSASAPPCFGPT